MTKSIPKKAKRLFAYNPKTGNLTWQPRPLLDFKSQRDCDAWNTRYANTEAGYINSQGYSVIKIDYVLYKSHRIIAYLMKGWNKTDMEIDHRYGNRSDNRLEMLRPATHDKNCYNKGLRSDNTSGYPGVTFDKNSGRWKAQITIDRKTKHLGLFDTAYEAHLAYEKAAKRLFGKFKRHYLK